MKRFLRIAAINISLVCLLIGMIELTGQVVFYCVKGYPVHDSTHRKLFELHPYLVGRLKKNVTVTRADKIITTTDAHTRYTGKAFDNDSIKVAVLGGSATFGTGATDLDTWPALLQNILGDEFSVINYGVPGYSSAEAVIQLALIVPEVKPHFVVMYQGWNDIRNYHAVDLGPDYFRHGMMQYNSLQIPIWTKGAVFSRLSERSAIVHFTDKVRKKLKDHKLAAGMKDSREADAYVDSIYARNLGTMKMLTNSMNAYALFVPQVINSSDFIGKKGSRAWTPRIEDDALPALLNRFNRNMSAVCQKGDANCGVLDDVVAEHWEADDFIDDGHFSRKGGTRLAHLVAQRIQQTVKQRGLTSLARRRTRSEQNSVLQR